MRLLATRQDFTLIQGATDQTFCFQFCAKPFMGEASGRAWAWCAPPSQIANRRPICNSKVI
jgi:hypothetical protein